MTVQWFTKTIFALYIIIIQLTKMYAELYHDIFSNYYYQYRILTLPGNYLPHCTPIFHLPVWHMHHIISICLCNELRG